MSNKTPNPGSNEALGDGRIVYAVDVPYISIYTYWVEAESEKEAVAKAKKGDLLDVEEVGEVTGTYRWSRAVAREDPFHIHMKGKKYV